jgi:outer membrane protein OmpA-like peptidoglycan-associated protein
MTLLLGVTMFSGCATKKYVLNTTEPIRGKLDQVGDQANKNTAAIDENRKEIKAVDERAESGISVARERAMTAENRAAEAMKRATEAAKAAEEAQASAARNAAEIQSVRDAVSKIDDYKPVAGTTIQFAFGQDKLSGDAKNDLDNLVAGAMHLKRFTVVVEGFTDHIGSPEYNNALSQRRARAVVSYLITRHNIPVYRISMVGLGSQKQVEEGKTREARSKSRRVEVKIFSADPTSATASPRA